MALNPLQRRGMIGALALLGLAPKALVRDMSESPTNTAGNIGSVLCEAVPSPPDGEHDRRWSLYDALRRDRRRAERREEIQRHLLGGWPPELHSMHSNARWFRAMSAARRIEAQEDAGRDWSDRLYDRIVKQGLGS